MPTKTTKPKPNEIYVCVQSFAGNDFGVAEGKRLRGDSEIVQKYFDRFVPESTPDDEIASRRAVLNAPSPPPEPLTGRFKVKILQGPPSQRGEVKATVGTRALYEGDVVELDAKDAEHLLDVGVAAPVESLPKRLAKAGAIATGRTED